MVRAMSRPFHRRAVFSLLVAALLAPLCLRAASVVIALDGTDTVKFELQVHAATKAMLSFVFADKKSLTMSASVKEDRITRTVEKDGKKTPVESPMPDAAVEFSGSGLAFQNHVRPHLRRYTEDQRVELAKRWDLMPPASEHWTAMEIRSSDKGAELWVEGRFCGQLASTSALVSLSVDGASVRGVKTSTREATGRFLPLNAAVLPCAPQANGTGVKLDRVLPIPMITSKTNVDVGEAKMMQGPKALETDENTSRTSLDGMKESLHYSVPQAFYHRAWVLCAVDDDPKKDPVLTTRLTRFATSGRGGAIADTSITLPRGDEQPGTGIQRVGTADLAMDGKVKHSPLYLVEVELKLGEILDLLAMEKDTFAAMKIGPYLDFEFLGKLGTLQVQSDRRHKPFPDSRSAVQVFGVTLERAPVEMRLKQSQPGNLFHNDEVPQTAVTLHASDPGEYALRWQIADVAGKVLKQHEQRLAMKAGDDKDVTLDLAMPELGWYALRMELIAGERCVLKHDAAFALLGPDTRKAGYESPYGVWWFGGAHYCTRDLNVVGPMLMKAGMRRVPVGWTQDTEADFAPWKVTLNQIKWGFRIADLDDWPAAEARAEKSIGDLVKRFPSCRHILLYHESYDPGGYPPELYGEKYEPKDPAQLAKEDKLIELGIKAATLYRQKFPQLKIIAGNSGGSSGMIAAMLRRGFPKDLIDYFGTETTGQTIAPEKLSPHTTGGIWLMGETARHFGYDQPLTGCYEYTSRAERDLGPQRHAEWYAKDYLHGLANRFPTISPALIEDVGNAYYSALWGGSGLCERKGLWYPKPAYVAAATLTRVLDSVTLVKQMDTGSSSAHVLEFARGGERVYALWTARGRCEMQFEFDADTPLRLTSFYGSSSDTKTKDKRLTLTASSAVSYFTSPKAARSVIAGARSFDLPLAGTHVVASLDDAAQCELVPGDPVLITSTRKPGQFTMRTVQDEERGSCIELELKREGTVPAVVGEYATLQLRTPAAIPGEPHSVGLWVKGDSSWGRVFWEITDAKGERWRSNGGYDGGDWSNASSIDFDGWCFMPFPLTDDSPYKQIEPGFGKGQWKPTGGDGNGRLDPPLKLTALHIETHRQSVNLTKMEPVKRTLRIRDVSVIGAK